MDALEVAPAPPPARLKLVTTTPADKKADPAACALLKRLNAHKDLIDKKIKGADGREKDLSWHRGFYTEAATFDVEKALANPDSEDYKLLLQDMDVIADQLKKLQAAGVPVLWRPPHEAEGGWF